MPLRYGGHDRHRNVTTGKRMSRYIHNLLLAALITFGLISMDEAAAAKKGRSGEMSAEEAAAQVQRRTGGQALGVEVEKSGNGRTVYRVRVLTRDGRVREVRVDSRSRED